MNNLLNHNGAIFSKDRKYRFCLWRIWDYNKSLVMFIGLNPSTANEDEDDPTIRRVKSFANRWGFGGVYMLNLFTWVTAHPEELKRCQDPLLMADYYLKLYASKSKQIIFAWGNFPEAAARGCEVSMMLPNGQALFINKDGSPRHPLYVPGDTIPQPFYSADCLHDRYCDQQATRMKCKSKSGCNFKSNIL